MFKKLAVIGCILLLHACAPRTATMQAGYTFGDYHITEVNVQKSATYHRGEEEFIEFATSVKPALMREFKKHPHGVEARMEINVNNLSIDIDKLAAIVVGDSVAVNTDIVLYDKKSGKTITEENLSVMPKYRAGIITAVTDFDSEQENLDLLVENYTQTLISRLYPTPKE